MKTRSLLLKLSKKYPKWIAKKYNDFPGLQYGKLKDETNTILLCLDFDQIVLDYIKNNDLTDKIDLIITHHPFIYGKFSEVIKNNMNKKKLCDELGLINMPIYSFHTNFDEGKEGMNDALTSRLELIDVQPLFNEPCARGGKLKQKMNVYDFAKYAKEKLNVDYGLLLPYGKEVVSKVAIIGGGGWHSFKIAQDEGYDIFISGDMPHHGRRDVIANKYNYLDLPHEIEKIFMFQMKKVINNIDSNIEVLTIDHEELPKVI